MRVHPNQINPNTELNALYAAERTAAKREIERTRKKLLEFVSKLAGEADPGEDCIVKLDMGRKPEGAKSTKPRQREKQDRPNLEDADNSISDWA